MVQYVFDARSCFKILHKNNSVHFGAKYFDDGNLGHQKKIPFLELGVLDGHITVIYFHRARRRSRQGN